MAQHHPRAGGPTASEASRARESSVPQGLHHTKLRVRETRSARCSATRSRRERRALLTLEGLKKKKERERGRREVVRRATSQEIAWAARLVCDVVSYCTSLPAQQRKLLTARAAPSSALDELGLDARTRRSPSLIQSATSSSGSLFAQLYDRLDHRRRERATVARSVGFHRENRHFDRTTRLLALRGGVFELSGLLGSR